MTCFIVLRPVETLEFSQHVRGPACGRHGRDRSARSGQVQGGRRNQAHSNQAGRVSRAKVWQLSLSLPSLSYIGLFLHLFRYGGRMPKTVEILAAIPQKQSFLIPMLKAKPVRSASGIAVVAVMCKPHRCPHITMTGNICVYW